MHSRYALGFLFLLVTCVLPALGQMRSPGRSASYTIDGTVTDENTHQSISGIRVDLKQSAGIPINSTFTGGGGNFEFVGVTNGTYTIEINEKGYEPVRQGIEIRNQSQLSVSVSLTKSAFVVNPGASSGATISAHQLSVPRKARDEYEKGIDLLYRKSDYLGAITQFDHAIKDYPTYYEAYADMGDAYQQLHEADQAEAAFRKSVDLSSSRYPVALVMLAELLNDANRFEEAATFARKAVDVDPSSWNGPFELARALSGLKQTDEAEKSAIQARDLNPQNAPVYLMLANIHIEKQDLPALLKDLDTFLKLSPSGPNADQVRKLQADLLAAKQQAEQAGKDSGGRASADTASSPGKQKGPAVDPDLSGLPSLPPPAQSKP
jgi:Flp pilus assembly protein TadD